MIWLYWGNKRMSFLRYMTVHSACSFCHKVILIVRDGGLHGDWKERQDMRFYKGPDYTSWLSDLPNLEVIHLDRLYPDIDDLKAPEVHTSDLLTWRLLADYGGTVSDMDIVFVKPAPKVKTEVQLIRFEKGYMPVSFLQGRPCSFWKEIYHAALENYSPDEYESCGTPNFHKVPLPIGTYTELPPEVVFPFHNMRWAAMKQALFRRVAPLPEQTVGIHWYAGVNQIWNKKITHENFNRFKCSVTEAIKVSYAS